MSNKQDNYSICLATHKGLIREQNEDNFVVNSYVKDDNNNPQAMSGTAKEPTLTGVFDGMGGEKGGAEASAVAAKTAVSFYHYLIQNKIGIDKVIKSYVFNCNKLISEYMDKNKLKRCGSTFSMVYLNNGFAYAVSLGDSRIYLYSGGQLRQISVDHTLANKKYEANIYTREEADQSSDSHILTAYLGINNESSEVFAQVYKPFKPSPNDKILICSDGLYDMCSDAEIAAVLAGNNNNAEALIDAALAKGGEDNVTCLVIERL